MENTCKKLKQLLSILLCLCMVLGLIPATVSAAVQVSIPGSFNNWNTNAWVMTSSSSNIYTYQVDLEATTYEFKIMDNGAWLGNNGTISNHTNGYEWIFSDNANNCKLTASGGTYTFTYNRSTKGLKVERSTGHKHDYDVTFSWSDYNATCTATKVCACGTKTTESCAITKTLKNGKLTFSATCEGVSDSVTVDHYPTEEIYVDVSAMGWTKVNAYYWGGSTTVTWPGKAMTKVSNGLYSITIPAGHNMIIFNNGTAQTNDLNMPTQGENIAVVKSTTNVGWGYKAPPSYTLTFTNLPDCGYEDWSYSITKPAGAPITAEDLAAMEAAIPVVENYHVAYWYLDEDTQTEIPETMPGYDLTIYAYWEGVESFVYFYSDPSMSEDSLLSASRFLYGETYDSLEDFIHTNCLNDDAPEGYHATAVKYADGTDLKFPYIHGTEDLNLYVEFARYACDPHTEETVAGYAATCTTPGLTDGVKCSVCGETLVEQKQIPVLPHTEETVAGYAATCTAPGLTDGVKCSACGETLKTQEKIPAKGHSFEDEICSACGLEKYVTIYFQNNWIWSDVRLYYWGSDIEEGAAWPGNAMNFYDKDGTYDYYVLKVPTDVDGIVINGIKNDGSGNRDQTPNITGNWYNGICYYMGYDNGNTTGSFDIDDAVFPCKHPNQKPVSGHEATCTETGLTDGIVCADCGETIKAQDEIPAKGHNWNDATCTEAKTCSVCGATEGEALGHNWDDATCTEAKTCSVCGATEGEALGHNWNDATCTEAKTCSVCGATEGEPAGHGYMNGYEYIETSEGHEVRCADCSEYYYQEDHSYGENHYCICGAAEPMTVTFMNGDEVWDVFERYYETWVAFAGMEYPTKEGYSFTGWYTAEGEKIHNKTVVTDNMVVYADFRINTYTVTWIVDGVATEETYEYGQTPVFTGSTDKAQDGCTVYTFDGWDREIVAVTDNVTYTAVYTETAIHSFTAAEYKWAEDYATCTAIGVCACGETASEIAFSAVCELKGASCVNAAYLEFRVGFDAPWAELQTVEAYDPAGEKNPDVHAAGSTIKTNNGDGTHAELWPCCNKIVIAAQEHVDTNGQDGRCDECHGLVHPAYLRQVSVSLKGNIALNYYMLLSEEVLADETAYMQFTMADGEVIKLPVSQGVEQSYQGETYYVFTCAVSAKEMTDTVLSQFYYDGGSTREHTYSVQTYAKHILANYDDAAIKDLITSMLNYGAASQLHFGYNTDKLANADLEAPDYSNVTIDGFKPVAGQGTELAKLYSASLILKSETTLRIFFKVDAAVENLTVTYQGQALEVKQRSGLSYVDVVGISAKALDEVVTVTVNDGANTAEVAFNPMSYSQGVLNDTTGAFGQDMKDLVAALYLYNKAANVYFKEV